MTKISTKPMVWFNVKAPNNIKRVSISINDRIIGSTEYRWDSNNITDVIISNLWEEFGNWELTLLAVDTEWYSNRSSIDVSIVSSDTVSPFIIKDYTDVQENGDKYKVIVFLNDDLSSVNWGTIKQWDKTIKTFSENIAEFNITDPGVITIIAKDWFGNEMTDTIDVRDYIDWYEQEVEVVEEEEIIEETEPEEIIEEILSGSVE